MNQVTIEFPTVATTNKNPKAMIHTIFSSGSKSAAVAVDVNLDELFIFALLRNLGIIRWVYENI